MQNLFNLFKQNLTRRRILQTTAISITLFTYYKREKIVNSIDRFYGIHLKPYELNNSELQKLLWDNLNVNIEVTLIFIR